MSKRRTVQCDICGKTVHMADTDKNPIHVTRFGSQWIHPEHALFGFPLPESEKVWATTRHRRTWWQRFKEWFI